ncbi:MAG: glycosyltransferase [Methylococcaceae bacterium]
MRRLLNISTLIKRPPTLQGKHANLKIALISDELTRSCLALECQLRHVTPLNYKWVLKTWKPDLLLVESAWQGFFNAWKYKIADYPDYPERNNNKLKHLVNYAKENRIPTVFWNKEDSVHFKRFIDSAVLFDYIFTVDANCIPRYQQYTQVPVNSLLFAVQPAIHYPVTTPYKQHRACFVGSYSHHVHDRRRYWQDMFFNSCNEIGLTVFDRNSSRRSTNYRYPNMPWLTLQNSVAHEKTAAIYRDYMVSLNVNTIEDSQTMFSRRLIEILACGSLAVTNPALSVDYYFKEYCLVIHSEEQLRDLFAELKYGLRPIDIERAKAAADYVLKEHTWSHRLTEILRVIS